MGLFHRSDLIRRRFALIRRLPGFIRHAIDRFAALVLGERHAFLVGGILQPVRQVEGRVLAPFLKAGYELLFYDVSRDLTPIFDERVLDRISVVNLCGYYGFCSYDREFIRKCSERGISIVEDTTHSIFSADGVDPHCDYVVGSMRKNVLKQLATEPVTFYRSRPAPRA